MASFVTTVRLNSARVAKVTNGGGTSKDVRVLTCTCAPSSSYVGGKTVFGLSGAARILISIVRGLRRSLRTSVGGICIKVNKRSVQDAHGGIAGRLKRSAGVSRTLVRSLVRDGQRVSLVSRRVLSMRPRRCGMKGGLLARPINVSTSHVRKHCLGVVTRRALGSEVAGYFGRAGCRVTSCFLSPIIATDIMLASDRGHSNYTLISLNTSAAAITMCGGGVLHRLTIVPLKDGGVAGSVYDLRVRRRSTRRLGLHCKYTLAPPTRGSRATSRRRCDVRKGYDVTTRGLRCVIRTHIGRVVSGM